MSRSQSIRSANQQLQIVVLGYLVRGPLGGLAWHYLQYVLGLQQLGHRVYFLEDSDDYESCYDPDQNMMVTTPNYGIRFAREAFDRLGIGDCWCYYDAHENHWLGPAAPRVHDLVGDADVMINVSGVTRVRHGLDQIPCRALIDTDPAFTQIRHLTDDSAKSEARLHTCFFTFGENFGGSDCSIPDDGFPWQATRQPVVLDAWPVLEPVEDAAFSTVMQWDSYPAVEFNQQRYGMKSDSFAPLIDLPTQTRHIFDLAVGSPSAPKEMLREKGWHVINPLVPTKNLWTYQDFIARSKGEFGVAKHGYVVSRSGWFSERTAAYLASGRPAVVEDTAFGQSIPVGRGLFSFTNVASAVAALDQVMSDPKRHSRAAREIAESHFDSTRVLTQLIDRCFTS